MALRSLATRMRSPAAAALRHAAPPLPSRLFISFEEDKEDVKRLCQENLATLDRVKKHQEFMRARVGFLEKGNKCLSWSFKLLFPVHVVAVVPKVTTR